ncbi:MAG: transposase [bacterium]|nr:transposase [candidate division KSB1 bacterium]MDH7560808.1 transposase [bacterium]
MRLANLERHFSNVHLTVSQYRRDVWQLALTLLVVVVRVLALRRPLTFSLDSTLVRKFGRTMLGWSFHFNYARKRNLASYIWGHEWIIMGVLLYATLLQKWPCVPFMAGLVVPDSYLPDGVSSHSRGEIAADMVRRVKTFLIQPFVLVVDGAFAKGSLMRTFSAKGVTLISRLQKNAVLDEAPTARRPPRAGPSQRLWSTSAVTSDSSHHQQRLSPVSSSPL